MRLVLSLLMIGGIIAGFAFFIVPQYSKVQDLRGKQADYEQILTNARKLQEERNKLVEKYNSFSPEDLQKLAVLAPESPDNVKLILQLDTMARANSLILQNVKIEEAQVETASRSQQATTAVNPDLGTLGMNFTVVGRYLDFTEFIRSLETSMRIVDIQKIAFATNDAQVSDNMQYSVALRAYWIK